MANIVRGGSLEFIIYFSNGGNSINDDFLVFPLHFLGAPLDVISFPDLLWTKPKMRSG